MPFFKTSLGPFNESKHKFYFNVITWLSHWLLWNLISVIITCLQQKDEINILRKGTCTASNFGNLKENNSNRKWIIQYTLYFIN